MAFRNLLKSAAAFACLSVLAAGVGLAPARADDKITIIMGGGPLWDPFFGAMKKGADDAAKDLGVDYQWVTGTDPNNLMPTTPSCSNSRRAVIPSALVIGNYFPRRPRPDHQGHHRERAIPVIHLPRRRRLVEGGRRDRLRRLQLHATSASQVAELSDQGRRQARALRQPCPRQFDARTMMCAGYEDAFKDAGGSAEAAMIQFSDAYNPTLVTQAIKGQLQADQTIDAV